MINILDKDREQLKTLLAFLRQSFEGCSFGDMKIDDLSESLERVIDALEEELRT